MLFYLSLGIVLCVCVCVRAFFSSFFFRTVLRISSNFPKHRLNNGPEKRIRIFLLSLCGARSHISSPKHSFDSNQQQTLLFVRNKQGLMPWKVKPVAFLPLFFYSPSIPLKTSTAVAPLGIWLKNLTLAEMLEMGLESQQERFKRLTPVSHQPSLSV